MTIRQVKRALKHIVNDGLKELLSSTVKNAQERDSFHSI